MNKMFLLLMMTASLTLFSQKKITDQTVEASCGLCQFDQKTEKGCNLMVKIDRKIYPVVGTGINDHGDAHGKDGFCSMVRKAKVSGEIKDGKFVSTGFKLLPGKQ